MVIALGSTMQALRGSEGQTPKKAHRGSSNLKLPLQPGALGSSSEHHTIQVHAQDVNIFANLRESLKF